MRRRIFAHQTAAAQKRFDYSVKLPDMPISNASMWRSPTKLFEVNMKPWQIYQMTQQKTSFDRVFFSSYQGKHIVVGDFYKLKLYQINKQSPYVSTKHQAEIVDTGIEYGSTT